MTQTYKKSLVIKNPKVEEIEHPEVQTPIENEVDDLLGDLNPKYFEEIISLKDAKEQIYASEVNFSSKFNIFRPY
jgi:hypothetical protein